MVDDFVGVIIEESLEDKTILKKVKIVKTEVEWVTGKHKTPWLERWTLHSVEIPEATAATIATVLSHALHPGYWYADFKNRTHHYIIFHERIFYIDKRDGKHYGEARKYGLSLGIPMYLNFASLR